MKTKGKAWHLIATVLLIVVFVYTAFFGVYAKYGDTTTTYIKGAKDIRFGVDIKGGVNVTFVPSDAVIRCKSSHERGTGGCYRNDLCFSRYDRTDDYAVGCFGYYLPGYIFYFTKIHNQSGLPDHRSRCGGLYLILIL